MTDHGGHVKKREQHRTVKKKKNNRCQTDSTKRVNVSVQYNGGLLSDSILLTQCYYRRGTRLYAMKRFCNLQLMIPPKRFDIFPPDWGMLRRSRRVTANYQIKDYTTVH